MKKIILSILVVAIIIGVGTFFYFISQPKSETNEVKNQKEELNINFPYVLLKFDKIPGSDSENLKLVSGIEEKSVATGTNQGKIKVRENKVITVAVMDISRDFGWTAIIANSDNGIINQENSYVNNLEVTLNSLSTAVQMVFMNLGMYNTDPEEAKTILSEIEEVPEVIALSKKLKNNANQKNPLDILEVNDSYKEAVEASVERLNKQEEKEEEVNKNKEEIFNSQEEVVDCETVFISKGENIKRNINNFDCLIEAAENCNPAKLLFTIKIGDSDIVSETTYHMEIKGKKEERCLYYREIKKVVAEYSEQAKDEFKERGMTQEEIEAEDEYVNNIMQPQFREKIYCKYEKENLVDIIKKWKKGEMSMKDFSNCKEDPSKL